MPTQATVVDAILQLGGFQPIYGTGTVGGSIGTTETLFKDTRLGGSSVVVAAVPLPGTPFGSPKNGFPTSIPPVPFGSSRFPANTAQAGQTFDARQPFIVRASGTGSTGINTQLQIVLYATNVISGAASFGTIGPVTINNTARSWFIECFAAYDPVGPGRIQGQTHGFIGQTGLALGANEFSLGVASAANPLQFSVSAKWSSDDASNQVTLKNFTIDPL